jgi:hypothetical protein
MIFTSPVLASVYVRERTESSIEGPPIVKGKSSLAAAFLLIIEESSMGRKI